MDETPRRFLTIPVPMIGHGGDITIEGAFPVTEAEWSHFMTILIAMKPGLVREPPGHIAGT